MSRIRTNLSLTTFGYRTRTRVSFQATVSRTTKILAFPDFRENFSVTNLGKVKRWNSEVHYSSFCDLYFRMSDGRKRESGVGSRFYGNRKARHNALLGLQLRCIDCEIPIQNDVLVEVLADVTRSGSDVIRNLR